jgi:hypothetical protein
MQDTVGIPFDPISNQRRTPRNVRRAMPCIKGLVCRPRHVFSFGGVTTNERRGFTSLVGRAA